jgi:hypothetical protein
MDYRIIIRQHCGGRDLGETHPALTLILVLVPDMFGQSLFESKDPRGSDVVAHTCIPSSQEAEAGEWRVQSQPGLHIKTLAQNTKHLPLDSCQQEEDAALQSVG